MPVSAAGMFIAAASDVTVARSIAGEWVGERPWLFIVGEALASDPDRERLIAAAMLLMARDDLVVVRLDGAELPLGFRDLDTRDVSRERLADAAGDRRPASLNAFSEAVDLYSTTASIEDDDVPLDALRPPAPTAPRFPAWSLLLAAGLLLLVVSALGFWLLAGEAPVGKPLDGRPAQAIQSRSDFIAGMLVALAIVAAILWLGRWIRGRAPLRKRRATVSTLFSPSVRWGIFISYSHRDSRIAHDLAEEVQRQGRSAWIFEQQMQGGATGWAAQVVKALRESRAVMLVGSSSAFGSDQVMREMYLAMEMHKPIVPLIVDDAPMPDDFQYILAKFQRHSIQPPLDTLIARALADC